MKYLPLFSFIFFTFVLLSGCELQGQLELLKKIETDVPEASGMTLDATHLYIVSDKNGDIYKLDLDGQIVDRLKTKTKDVEGIAMMNDEFILIDEANQKAYSYDLLGNRLHSKKLDHPEKYDPQNGLEGIAYDKWTNQVLVINEKKPRLLLQYDKTWNLITKSKLEHFSDHAGIATTKNHIWIISDEAAGLAQYDRNMKLIKVYSMGIDSPEGIAIDEKKGVVYIVSDTTSELCVFRLPVNF